MRFLAMLLTLTLFSRTNMTEETHRILDTWAKFLAVCALLIGLHQFNKQQRATVELEYRQNVFQREADIYAEVCRNAGAMAASLGDPVSFAKDKQLFLQQYYGAIVLVDDSAVAAAMCELRAYLEDFEPKDENMGNILKIKIVLSPVVYRQPKNSFRRQRLVRGRSAAEALPAPLRIYRKLSYLSINELLNQR